MKIKQSSVCHTCRAHKIGCDGKRPTCSQCSATKRKCEGYQLETVFVPYSSKSRTKSSRRVLSAQPSTKVSLAAACKPCITSHTLRVCVRQPEPHWISGPIGPVTSDEFTNAILNRFLPGYETDQLSLDPGMSQVCGAWVEILPSLVAKAQPGGLISLATRAFGTAILDKSQIGKGVGFRSREAYIATLHELRKAILSLKSCLTLETAAAIACLAMAELLLPTPKEAMYTHCRGLSALLGSYPPELFCSDSFHFVFVGCRPVLLFQALAARQPTFLGQEKWLKIPFQHHPPSDLQKLISEAAILPSIMQEIDMLPTLPHRGDVSRASQAKYMLLEVLGILDEWKGRFGRVTVGFPGGYLKLLDPGQTQGPIPKLWYSNVLAANVHIHLWAFQIICLTELDKLNPYMSDCQRNKTQEEEIHSEGTRKLVLATKIYQSVEYLLQDTMNLHGPAAALFPLGIAYEVFVRDLEGNKEHIRHCERFFERIYSKGITKAGTLSVKGVNE